MRTMTGWRRCGARCTRIPGACKLPDRCRALLEAGGNLITINTSYHGRAGRTDGNGEEEAGSILHEVQHVIQNYEGFAEGSSPDQVARRLDEAIRAEKDALGETGVDSATYPAPHIKGNRKRRGASWRRLRLLEGLHRRLMLHNLDVLGIVRALQGKPSFRYELYRRVAGEIEARTVAARMGMSAEERAARPFNEQEADVRSLSGKGMSCKSATQFSDFCQAARQTNSSQLISVPRPQPIGEAHKVQLCW